MDFINENKNGINKKANSTTTMTTEIFKCYKNSTLFDVQTAGNCIFELLDFKFFWGGDPRRERDLAAPLVVTAAYTTSVAACN